MSDETRAKIAAVTPNQQWSSASRQRLSEVAKARGLGGHTSKRSVRFQRKDGNIVFLQSSYEVMFATILEDHDIEWRRPPPLIWCDGDGNDHRYYPDFQIGSVFFDTKNDYLIKKDEDKISRVCEQNGVIVHVIAKHEIDIDTIRSRLGSTKN